MTLVSELVVLRRAAPGALDEGKNSTQPLNHRVYIWQRKDDYSAGDLVLDLNQGICVGWYDFWVLRLSNEAWCLLNAEGNSIDVLKRGHRCADLLLQQPACCYEKIAVR